MLKVSGPGPGYTRPQDKCGGPWEHRVKNIFTLKLILTYYRLQNIMDENILIKNKDLPRNFLFEGECIGLCPRPWVFFF